MLPEGFGAKRILEEALRKLIADFAPGCALSKVCTKVHGLGSFIGNPSLGDPILQLLSFACLNVLLFPPITWRSSKTCPQLWRRLHPLQLWTRGGIGTQRRTSRLAWTHAGGKHHSLHDEIRTDCHCTVDHITREVFLLIAVLLRCRFPCEIL